jgi:hypothetical protein
VVAWEFRVRGGCQAQYEQAYGPQGPWVQLFRTSPDFIKTDLHRDLADPGRYWTLDFWTSELAYDQFRLAHADEYHRIDAQCEQWTEGERELGRFTPVR